MIQHKNRTLALVLALIMGVTVYTPAVFAAGTTDGTEAAAPAAAAVSEDTVTTSEPGNPDDADALFAGYVDQQLAEAVEEANPYVSAQAVGDRSRGAKLTGMNRIIYDYLKPKITEIADGKRASTAFVLSLTDLGIPDKDWSAADLGVKSILTRDGRGISEEAKAAAWKLIKIDDSAINKALLADCPYDLYWYDKVVGMKRKTELKYDPVEYGDEWKLSISGSVTITFAVSRSCSAGTFTVNTVNAQRVQKALATAQAIVEEHKDDTNLHKLSAYRKSICDLVRYDTSIKDVATTAYGDSWQVISVFDGDKTTNVVCEGYAKAFQLLCDLTAFNGNVSCFSVSGTMAGGTGAGSHMWNVVRMDDGKNYLVDLTNCDGNTVGSATLLFLRSYKSGTLDNGYVFTPRGNKVTYKYDKNTRTLYSDAELRLSGSPYVGEGSKEFYSEPDTVVVKATSITKLVKAKRAFTVKWKRVTGVKGYQIQYARKSSFKGARTVVLNKSTYSYLKVIKLKSKKKYYVRVRTYKVVNGVMYYSAWSKKKAIKVK